MSRCNIQHVLGKIMVMMVDSDKRSKLSLVLMHDRDCFDFNTQGYICLQNVKHETNI